MTVHRTDKRKDVFHLSWIEGAFLCGEDEIPLVVASEEIPESLIPFSVAVRKRSLPKEAYQCYVHFFEYDYKFWRLFRNPKRYVGRLKKFKGVISPDVSVYYDTPLTVQRYNVFLSRAVSFFLSKNGLKVIPLARWGNEKSYSFAFTGLQHNSFVFVSPYGCREDKEERTLFFSGLLKLIENLRPRTLLFFGKAPKQIRDLCAFKNVLLVEYKVCSRELKISTRLKMQSDEDLPLFKEVI